MMSNGQYSPFYREHFPPQPKQFLQEDVIKTAELQVERKTFIITLRENMRGRFIRITEETTRQRNSIIVPESGLEEFTKVLGEMTQAALETPERGNSGQGATI
jgi:hypothetical protein